VVKLNSAGAYQWHTFYGAAGADNAYSAVIDSSANIYIAGYSEAAWDGPGGQSPLNAFAGGGADMVVLKLSSAGAYRWHTFCGGSGGDSAYAIASDSSFNLYLGGTSSATWNGPSGQAPVNAFTDAAVTAATIVKLDSAGAYQWHTFHGETTRVSKMPLTRRHLYLCRWR
jgi:hypothetical protein